MPVTPDVLVIIQMKLGYDLSIPADTAIIYRNLVIEDNITLLIEDGGELLVI